MADPLWWLSFADPGKPKETQFLGVVIIQGTSFTDAVAGCIVLGLNPGGEVKGAGPLPAEAIAPEWRERLLSKEEAESIPAPGDHA